MRRGLLVVALVIGCRPQATRAPAPSVDELVAGLAEVAKHAAPEPAPEPEPAWEPVAEPEPVVDLPTPAYLLTDTAGARTAGDLAVACHEDGGCARPSEPRTRMFVHAADPQGQRLRHQIVGDDTLERCLQRGRQVERCQGSRVVLVVRLSRQEPARVVDAEGIGEGGRACVERWFRSRIPRSYLAPGAGFDVRVTSLRGPDAEGCAEGPVTPG